MGAVNILVVVCPILTLLYREFEQATNAASEAGSEFCSTVLAVYCIVRIAGLATRTGAPDDWHSWDCEGLACSLIQVEFVSVVASKSGDMIALECPLSFRWIGHRTPTSRTVEEDPLPQRPTTIEIFKIGLAEDP